MQLSPLKTVKFEFRVRGYKGVKQVNEPAELWLECDNAKQMLEHSEICPECDDGKQVRKLSE